MIRIQNVPSSTFLPGNSRDAHVSIFLTAENVPVTLSKNNSNNDSDILAEYNGGVITRRILNSKFQTALLSINHGIKLWEGRWKC